MISGLDALFAHKNAVANTSSTSSGSANSQPAGSLGGGLDANSVITLLTAQLKAQDPLNPMDPDQMVNELTAMNTLQQTIQMRQDLDGLLSAAGSSGTKASNGDSSSSGSNGNTPPPAK